MMKASSIANSNIAFVKYWGKKNSKLNIPMNPSISMTLDEKLSTKTTIEFSEKYSEDIFILNNVKQHGDKSERVSNFLNIIRETAHTKLKAKVVSVNSFPTASGLASSASGFAALAAASSSALNLNLTEKELSGLARLGSGSATRSIYGGFVEWEGKYAKQLIDEHHWPQLRDMVVIVSKKEKPLSSREAMQISVKKSTLYRKRINTLTKTLDSVKMAITNKNFPDLAKLIMRDSDNMHACINETGIQYLNDTSENIKQIIKRLNNTQLKAAYSFDAGPNAHIITLEKHIPELRHALSKVSYVKIIVSKPGAGVRLTKKHLF